MPRRRPGRSIYRGPPAPALCCRKSRLLLARPHPPRRSPRGFVYGLGVFSEAPAARAPDAVAQPRAGGNLKPRCQAGAPAAPPPRAPQRPPSFLPLPPGRSCRRRQSRARRSLGKPRPVLPRLPGWRGAGRRPERRLGHSRAGAGRTSSSAPLPSPPPSPSLPSPLPYPELSLSPAIGAALPQLREHRAAGSRAGEATAAPGPLSSLRPRLLDGRGQPLRGGGGEEGRPPPRPRTAVSGSLARPVSRVPKKGQGQEGRAASAACRVGVGGRDSPPPNSLSAP